MIFHVYFRWFLAFSLSFFPHVAISLFHLLVELVCANIFFFCFCCLYIYRRLFRRRPVFKRFGKLCLRVFALYIYNAQYWFNSQVIWEMIIIDYKAQSIFISSYFHLFDKISNARNVVFVEHFCFPPNEKKTVRSWRDAACSRVQNEKLPAS